MRVNPEGEVTIPSGVRDAFEISSELISIFQKQWVDFILSSLDADIEVLPMGHQFPIDVVVCGDGNRQSLAVTPIAHKISNPQSFFILAGTGILQRRAAGTKVTDIAPQRVPNNPLVARCRMGQHLSESQRDNRRGMPQTPHPNRES